MLQSTWIWMKCLSTSQLRDSTNRSCMGRWTFNLISYSLLTNNTKIVTKESFERLNLCSNWKDWEKNRRRKERCLKELKQKSLTFTREPRPRSDKWKFSRWFKKNSLKMTSNWIKNSRPIRFPFLSTLSAIKNTQRSCKRRNSRYLVD